MRSNRFLTLPGILAAAGLALGCAKKEAPAPAASETPAAAAAAPSGGGKIPITTSSEEARSEYLKGRSMVDNLRVTDSVAHFQKAISLDPNFAMAELSMSGSAPTGTAFLEHLDKAVALSDKASNGEKLLILAAKAGSNNDIAKQKQYLDEVVAAYPNDERAQFALAGYWFGQQDFSLAIDHYRKATEIDPSYASAWNLLGYAYRQNGDFASSEKAFQEYIKLIPNDPNPYDSYAELLLKMGRFDDSIAQYRKALEIDPNFVNAYQGIAMGLLYQGKPADAAAQLQTFTSRARTDGERRTALFASAVVNADGGKMAKAIGDLDKQYAIAEPNKDVLGMIGDLQAKGNVLLEMGKPDDAGKSYERTYTMIQASSLSPEIKENNARFMNYNRARVAVAKKDLAKAKSISEEYKKLTDATNNPVQVRQAHELAGIIALAEKNWDAAVAELEKSNLQNPYNLYRLCQAYEARGDSAKAKDFCTRAAHFNSLPNLQYAFVRTKAGAEAK
jgi:tetratricopeptide (TPR) repeat protein